MYRLRERHWNKWKLFSRIYVHFSELVYMCTVCALYVHCMYTLRTLYVQCMCTVCTLYVHCMYTTCTLDVHCMCTVCLLSISNSLEFVTSLTMIHLERRRDGQCTVCNNRYTYRQSPGRCVLFVDIQYLITNTRSMQHFDRYILNVC